MAGLDPNVMGLGPVYAIKKLMKKLKMNIDEIDLFELNEAFAAQSLACVRELNLDPAKVNVNGGSIALGHPIGCSGARIVTTLIGALKRGINLFLKNVENYFDSQSNLSQDEATKFENRLCSLMCWRRHGHCYLH